MSNTKVWFVTGASKGLGLILVKQLLQQGNKVIATSRNVADLQNAITENAESFLPLAVEITSEASVASAIEKSIQHFGRIDVVVNNAGYGLLGSIEELTEQEVKDNFNVNVFGSLNVIRKAMPHLRAQRSGYIFNISSIGGFTGNFPGFGIYCATKFAVQGFTEALAAEAKSFGIKVTDVAPGYFRTNFLNPDSLGVPKNEIAEYKEVRDSQNMHQQQINGAQQGDPEKAAAAMIAMASEENPPLHLFLGQDAYDMVNNKIQSLQAELEKWKSVTTSTGFTNEK